jgi:hypothetical protein
VTQTAALDALDAIHVQDALRSAAARAASQVGTVFQPLITYEPPPTFHRTNKVTSAFQEIVDAYGEQLSREKAWLSGRLHIGMSGWGSCSPAVIICAEARR